jgi:hypothetical protein
LACCVRRPWLFGFDAYVNRDFDHRKHWIPKRFKELNHFHLPPVFTLCASGELVLSTMLLLRQSTSVTLRSP